MLIRRERPDEVPPDFLKGHHEEGHGYGEYSEVYEDAVPGAEYYIDGVGVGEDDADHHLGGESEEHVDVVHALREDWLPPGHRDEVVEQLHHNICVEVGGLRVLNGLRCETDGPVGDGGYLLHPALTPLELRH